MREFNINLLYYIYKDKQFRICNDLRNMFMNRYKLTYEESNELILRIINYQIEKYGVQLHKYDWRL